MRLHNKIQMLNASFCHVPTLVFPLLFNFASKRREVAINLLIYTNVFQMMRHVFACNFSAAVVGTTQDGQIANRFVLFHFAMHELFFAELACNHSVVALTFQMVWHFKSPKFFPASVRAFL